MRILAVADVEDRGLWDYYTPDKVADVDLILSAGDLDADYLEFLVTMTDKPVLYVHGNHDRGYLRKPPLGCIDVDDEAYVYQGLRIVGLGGCRRYNDGPYQYTEKQMRKRIRKLTPKIRLMGGVDVLLTHCPAAGVGDLPDHVHQGFECLNDFVERWRPQVLVHGHIHQSYGSTFQRSHEFACGTRSLNACGKTSLDVEPGAPLRHSWVTSYLNSRCLKKSEGGALYPSPAAGYANLYR